MPEKNVIRLNEDELREIVKNAVHRTLTSTANEDNLDISSLFNIDSIPVEELRRQYVDLAFTVSSSGYGGRFMGANGKIIKEEATSTLPIDETKYQIQTKFHLKDWQFATQNGCNGIRLVVLYPGIFKNTKLIKDAMLACGWSLAVKGYIIKDKMIWRAMSFDPMFQKDVSLEARQYKYLYHWTPLYNYDAISIDGLKPRSENKLFDYPDRLHLIKGNTSNDELFNIGWQLCNANKRLKNKGNYVLLSINLAMIPSNTEIYYDPRYDWGYYIKTSVPPNAIKPVLGYNFKKGEQFSL